MEILEIGTYTLDIPYIHRLYLNRIVLIVGTPCLYSTNQTSSSSIDGESEYARLSVMSACCVAMYVADAHELDECLYELHSAVRTACIHSDMLLQIFSDTSTKYYKDINTM